MGLSAWKNTGGFLTLSPPPPTYDFELASVVVTPIIGGFHVVCVCDAHGWNFAYSATTIALEWRFHNSGEDWTRTVVWEVSASDNLPHHKSVLGPGVARAVDTRLVLLNEFGYPIFTGDAVQVTTLRRPTTPYVPPTT